MIKHIARIVTPVLLLIFSAGYIHAATLLKTGTLPLVDGIYNSTHVVVTDQHNPVFSWEYASASTQVSSFTVVVSSDPNTFSMAGEIWSFAGTTTTANTVNDITRVVFNNNATASEVLSTGRVYYWRVVIYQNGDTDVRGADGTLSFTTAASAVELTADKMDLAIDWNNPFNPETQYTVFRFGAKDRDRKVQLRIFTIAGKQVYTFAERTILKDAWYTQTWDGRNQNGEMVARGVYIVNVMDVGDGEGVNARVYVVK